MSSDGTPSTRARRAAPARREGDRERERERVSVSIGSREPEEPLAGGRLTSGVVRVGKTVRRPTQRSSAFTAELLRHLQERGFTGAPTWLGHDDRGRDVLSYVDGWVPAKWRRFTDGQVHLAGALLRAFHDATRGSPLAGRAAVVCHNDAGPNNVVFRDGRPVALIDFDLAAPGEPVEDLGYMAWSWCLASKPARQPVEAQAAQVRVLADAYGLDAAGRRGLTDAMIERQARNIRFWEDRRATAGGARGVRVDIDEVIAWSARELAFTRENRRWIEAALT
jgi:aminoglycoside phosphotransferase (APT) family kinase protein